MKDVVGYEDLFSITEDGKLWSKRTKRYLKQNVSKTGYWQVSTKVGGRFGVAKCFKVHRLVCEAYHDNPENKPFVNHKDGNKLNNHASNLEWCTHSENMIHAYETGLASVDKGISSANASLTQEQVDYIRKVYIPRDKNFGCRALANKLGVCHFVVSMVTLNKRY